MIRTVALCLLTGFALASVQQEPPAARFRDDFFVALKGDRASLERAISQSYEVLRAKPEDPEALVWHGAAMLLKAMQAYRNREYEIAEKYAREGAKEMDRAVAVAPPENIAVRVPRGLVLLTATRAMPALPNADQLLQRGLKDHERVLEVQTARFDTLSDHQKGELLFGLAEGWARAGNDRKARVYFQRLATDLKGTPYAARAASWFRNQSLSPEHLDCVGCHIK
jgi:hypothetical protein